jgi:single-strand DNA-binding protein
MANYNKLILVGNLTRDPELTYLPSNTPVAEFGLAVNRRYRTKDGQNREETCFIDCRCYGRQAEVVNQYMRKGRALLVEGRLTFDTWEAQDGSRRSKHRVFVENFQFLGGQGDGPGGGGGGGQYSRNDSYSQQSRPRGGPGPQQAPQGGAQGGPAGGGGSHDAYDDEPPPPDYDDGGNQIPF